MPEKNERRVEKKTKTKLSFVVSTLSRLLSLPYAVTRTHAHTISHTHTHTLLFSSLSHSSLSHSSKHSVCLSSSSRKKQININNLVFCRPTSSESTYHVLWAVSPKQDFSDFTISRLVTKFSEVCRNAYLERMRRVSNEATRNAIEQSYPKHTVDWLEIGIRI